MIFNYFLVTASAPISARVFVEPAVAMDTEVVAFLAHVEHAGGPAEQRACEQEEADDPEP